MQREMYIGILVGIIVSAAGFLGYKIYNEGDGESGDFTSFFNIEDRTFSSIGNNTYFILQPGYKLVLEGEEDGDAIQLNITVLSETKTINGIETRVVEERESANGELLEVSRNYFAIDTETNSVFYFGEAVDVYKDGVVVNHEGAWEAYSNENKPGLMMPSLILLGARYYQEVAPGIAEDRAEIVHLNKTVETQNGTFLNCLKIKETNPLDEEDEYKYYAPGIGLIHDADLTLVSYGYV